MFVGGVVVVVGLGLVGGFGDVAYIYSEFFCEGLEGFYEVEAVAVVALAHLFFVYCEEAVLYCH